MTSRQFHRRAGLAAALLFLFVSTTGVVLQCQKIFGDEDVNKEEMEQTASSQKLAALLATTLDAARAAVAARYSDATVGSVNWQFKGKSPLIVFHLDGPTNLRVSVDATTLHIVSIHPASTTGGCRAVRRLLRLPPGRLASSTAAVR